MFYNMFFDFFGRRGVEAKRPEIHVICCPFVARQSTAPAYKATTQVNRPYSSHSASESEALQPPPKQTETNRKGTEIYG